MDEKDTTSLCLFPSSVKDTDETAAFAQTLSARFCSAQFLTFYFKILEWETTVCQADCQNVVKLSSKQILTPKPVWLLLQESRSLVQEHSPFLLEKFEPWAFSNNLIVI